MKMIIFAAILLSSLSAFAAPKPWVSVEVKVKSHHGNDETMKLQLLKEGKAVKLIVDDFILPETRVLSNRQDIDTILNFTQAKETGPCGNSSFTYTKKLNGKTTQYSGCPTSADFSQLRKSFQNISAIR